LVKKKISNSPENDAEVFIIGISSSENDYKLAWAINTAFSINLSLQDDISLNQEHLFSFFLDDKNNKKSFVLIKNHASNAILSLKNKNSDYILILISPKKTENIADLLKQLKKIKEIRAAFEIKDDKILSIIPNKIALQ
jgi:hypothetical protein